MKLSKGDVSSLFTVIVVAVVYTGMVVWLSLYTYAGCHEPPVLKSASAKPGNFGTGLVPVDKLIRGNKPFIVGDSVAIILYDSGHWVGNYTGRIIEKNWTTNRCLVRSWNLRLQNFDYQWIDAINLEKAQ